MSNATKTKDEKIKLTTPEFRVSFPQVFEAKQVNGQGTAKFSIQMLFRVKADPKKPDEKVVDLTPLKNAWLAVAVSKFGTDKTKWPKLENPFRDGKEKDYDGYGDGIVFLTASSKMKPGVVHAHAGADGKPEPLTVPTDFYGGCYARATVNPYYWEFMGKKGISFGLQNVQKLKDGEMFGGRAKAEMDFDAIEPPQGATAVAGEPADPLAGMP